MELLGNFDLPAAIGRDEKFVLDKSNMAEAECNPENDLIQKFIGLALVAEDRSVITS